MTYKIWNISRTYSFSAAHRIEGHPKCGRLHGHNYLVKVILTQHNSLESDGMVLDYGRLDEVVKPIIEQLDHRYLVSRDNIEHDDPYWSTANSLGHAYLLLCKHSTAEELAQQLHFQITSKLAWPETDLVVEVQETEKSNAVFSLGE